MNRDGNIRCVVLNACYSEEQAVAISQHVDCVIGMANAISDDGARGFASSFYRGLAFGTSVKDSFLLGTNYLAMLGVLDEQVPKLHSRPSVDPAKIFLEAAPKQQVRQPSSEPQQQRIPTPPPGPSLDILGNWDATGYLMYGYLQSPITMRAIFYANGTFEESGTMGGAPFYSRGSYSFDPVRSLLVTQEYNAPFPTTFFLSGVAGDAFTANAPAGILNFRKLG